MEADPVLFCAVRSDELDVSFAAVTKINNPESRQVPDVRRRLDWAKRIATMTIRHPNAKYGFADVAGLIAASDVETELFHVLLAFGDQDQAHLYRAAGSPSVQPGARSAWLPHRRPAASPR